MEDGEYPLETIALQFGNWLDISSVLLIGEKSSLVLP